MTTRRAFDTVTVRWNEDPMAQVQALKNGEIDMFSPQVTTDVVKAAEKVKDVEIKKGVEGTFEHMDLVQNNKGPFDPATYGGDAQKALLVRQAFLHGVPAPGDRRQADQADQPRRRGPQLVPEDRRAPRATTRSSRRTAPRSTPRSTRPSRWTCSSRPASRPRSTSA